ncbi:MAG: acyl-CoA dehydrogenase family protein [Thermoanaerobaculia bacterium]|jgi:alkylation response protein AidB-like acyl-CoA dehydrogenase
MPIPEPPDVSYWDASPALRKILEAKLSAVDLAWAEPQLAAMGETAVREVAPRAAIADRESPRLVTHDARGNRVDRIDYHPAYREMQSIAYGSGMVGMKYDPAALAAHPDALQLTGFALGYLFAMGEMGLYCPVCMTDGVARILSLFGGRDRFSSTIDRLASTDPGTLWTGAMFLTEKVGGSDVGANEAIARQDSLGLWWLTGTKWFCSNVDADAILATARPEGAPAGTKGLKTWLVLRSEAPGLTIDRIKDKIGVRSMPTGEVTLASVPAVEVGDFHSIAEMLNLSRLYNSVAAVAVMGRAIHEARYYIERRRAFGKRVIEHALAQETLLDAEAEQLGALHLTFETVDLLGKADRGDENAARERRFLTPVVKAVTGKLAVPVVSECMELIGGNAYIEESPMPRLLRDAQVLPIWEGTTNILALDALRAAHKDEGHRITLARIARVLPEEAAALESAFESIEERQARGWMDRLARSLEIALLREAGEGAAADRLARRPMGLVPGACLLT